MECGDITKHLTHAKSAFGREQSHESNRGRIISNESVYSTRDKAASIESIEAALHGKSVNMMIETVSSWILPETSEYRREPARPVERRQANFDAQFDWHTVFYDCFRVQGTQAMLIGPPLTRFEGILDSLKIHALPTGNECRYEVHHKFTTAFANRRTDNLCRILIEVSEGDTCLQLQTRRRLQGPRYQARCATGLPWPAGAVYPEQK